ncbi:hypothetical protein N0V88_005721 [Collariella sp. IMI 366227]|nr:hypothetical protein N0V88_005721 [Collariella sp. IMI 366227]
MAPTVVLITGANRGIGRGLLELYLARSDHIVVATIRSPDKAVETKLASLPTAERTSLVVLKLDLNVASDPAAATKALSLHGIDHIDILIANAGIALKWVKVSEVTQDDIQQHVDVNVHGFVHLVQSFLPLLQKSKSPKLVTIGSSSAYLTTDLGQRGAAAFGYEKAAITVDESVNGIIKVVDAATRDTHGGKMWVYTGVESPW